MIPRTVHWKNALATAIRDPAELLALLDLPRELLPAAREAARTFPLLVPRGYAALMTKGDPEDPLLRQVLPVANEQEIRQGFSTDPVGDRASSSGAGLLHKYQGRVLLLAAGGCVINCRYCFRRHYPYSESGTGRWDEALGHIAADATVTEVILSGGDPLLVDDTRLADLATRLAAIPHVRRLRIHSRMPTVLPERVDTGLLDWLRSVPLQAVMVLHVNHANEIGAQAAAAIGRLRAAGIPLFNQSVLLRGVNNDADALCRLSEALFDLGVVPYYLHLLDRVAGAAHFEISISEADVLFEAMRRRLPGYLVPRLVRERAGEPYKLFA